MAGEDPTLVLRGSEQNLTFSRVSASDRFYIRMYDGSTPPNYSEFSTALFINLPLKRVKRESSYRANDLIQTECGGCA